MLLISWSFCRWGKSIFPNYQAHLQLGRLRSMGSKWTPKHHSLYFLQFVVVLSTRFSKEKISWFEFFAGLTIWKKNFMIEFKGTLLNLIFFAITYLQEGRYAGRYTRQKGMNDSTFAQFVSILITKTAPTKVSTQAVGAIIHAAKQWIIPFGSSRTLSFSSSRSLALTFSPSFAFAHFESVKGCSVKWSKDLYEINLSQIEISLNDS